MELLEIFVVLEHSVDEIFFGNIITNRIVLGNGPKFNV